MLHRHNMYWSTINNLAMWNPTPETVFINTLPHASCDVVSIGDGTEHHNIHTLRNVSDLSVFGRKKHCAVYCAHPACGAAKKAMRDKKKEITEACSTVDYILEGVRGMMLDTRFEISDAEACEESLQQYKNST